MKAILTTIILLILSACGAQIQTDNADASCGTAPPSGTHCDDSTPCCGGAWCVYGSPVILGNLCWLPPHVDDLCAELGASCDTASCCSGICEYFGGDGPPRCVAEEEEPACRALGRPCTEIRTCCPGLSCSAGTCS
jgi:hypothetical protein